MCVYTRVWMDLHVYSCVDGFTCIPMYLWRSGVSIGRYCLWLSIYLSAQGFWLIPVLNDWLGWLVSEPPGCSCPHLPMLGLQACTTMPGFSYWVLGISTRVLRLAQQTLNPPGHFPVYTLLIKIISPCLYLHYNPVSSNSL